MKVSRVKRKAAGKTLLFVFGVLEQCKHTLHFSAPDWSDTFTPREREYIDKLQVRLDQEAEACRKLAWKLIRS
jgi:hypothetical protein